MDAALLSDDDVAVDGADDAADMHVGVVADEVTAALEIPTYDAPRATTSSMRL